MEEVLSYFESRRSLLENQLKTAEQRKREVEKALLRLPLVIVFWYSPYRWLKKWWLSKKNRSLSKEVRKFKRRINRFIQAERELKKGNYTPAIDLIDALLRKIPPSFPETADFNGTVSTPNPVFNDILELREELIKLRAEKKEN